MKNIYRKQIVAALCAAAIIGGFACCAYAQVSPDDLNAIIRQQDRILQHDGQRLDQLERDRRQSRPPVAPLPIPDAQTVPQGGACFLLKAVTFKGADHLDMADRRAVAAPYLGRCITLADAEEMVRAVTNLYGERGYVTSRAFLHPQDIGDGELDILVVEGRIEGFDWNGENFSDRSERITAFPDSVGDILDLREVEQGLDQLNRLRSNNATMKLVPGEALGTSRVFLESPERRRWRLSAGVDNSGLSATGETQLKGSVEADNALGLNDSFYFSHSQDYLRDSSHRLSRDWSALASIPYGDWTLNATSSYFQYRSPIYGQAQTFQTSGMSRTYRLGLDRMLYRDDQGKTSGGVSLAFKSMRNYLEDLYLDTSSRKLAILGFSVSHTRKLAGGSVRVAAGYESGLPLLGAKNDSGRIADDPEAQFEKLTADLSYAIPFQVRDLAFGWSTAAHGQWSNDTLFNTERQSIGGASTVRGFKDSTLIGDSGGYVRNELSLSLPSRVEWLDAAVGVPRLFVAYDMGAIKRDHAGDEGGRLSGWATGLRLSGDYLDAELSYARAIARDHTVEARPHEISVSVSLAY